MLHRQTAQYEYEIISCVATSTSFNPFLRSLTKKTYTIKHLKEKHPITIPPNARAPNSVELRLLLSPPPLGLPPLAAPSRLRLALRPIAVESFSWSPNWIKLYQTRRLVQFLELPTVSELSQVYEKSVSAIVSSCFIISRGYRWRLINRQHGLCRNLPIAKQLWRRLWCQN